MILDFKHHANLKTNLHYNFFPPRKSQDAFFSRCFRIANSRESNFIDINAIVTDSNAALRLTHESMFLLIRVIARKRSRCTYFTGVEYRAAVGRRERRWQLNYYRDMHREYLIGERERSCARVHRFACVYVRVACAHTRPAAGTIGQSLPPVGTIKPELIRVFVNPRRTEVRTAGS